MTSSRLSPQKNSPAAIFFKCLCYWPHALFLSFSWCWRTESTTDRGDLTSLNFNRFTSSHLSMSVNIFSHTFSSWVTKNSFIHRVGVQMRSTMRQWLSVQQTQVTASLHQWHKWSNKPFIQLPDRHRKHLQLLLKVELKFYCLRWCISV